SQIAASQIVASQIATSQMAALPIAVARARASRVTPAPPGGPVLPGALVAPPVQSIPAAAHDSPTIVPAPPPPDSPSPPAPLPAPRPACSASAPRGPPPRRDPGRRRVHLAQPRRTRRLERAVPHG